jgi:nitric oxide reductase NorD protein
VKFDLDLPSAAHDDLPLGPGEKYPEWNYQTQRLQPEHCVVQRYTARHAPPYQPPAALRAVARRMRRRLEALRSAPARLRGRTEGDDIDVDAWIRYRVESGSGPRSEAPPVYVQRVRAERDLATLLLADLSLSTDAYATQEARVIDVIRDALHVFGEALAASSDAFEMLGFSSVRRSHVRIQHLKAFDEAWDGAAMARVNAIKPGYYTRMGAALRHATARLLQRGERQRLLIILTDGKPNDLDVYEGRYGLEDTRHAVREARALGLTPFCITIDAKAHDYLPHLFGSQGYALVHRPQDLVRRLASAYAGLTR